MTETFTPPRRPASPSSLAVEIKTAESAFGEGYSQRSGDGLNTEGRTWTTVWPVLTFAELEAIEGFFRAHKGYVAFFWKGPGDNEVMKYRCKTWQRSFAGGKPSLSATLERVFDR
ncbi:phage tail protein [Pleomorphomonas sp. JP5]|uniref:phage tail protein n=1 Tax=Pleomorphomonas sp. JP5 TaxID=2942998 RepID=UPI002043444A|nr:phage tail protein [Pleomorphomonas sp. JP5]MCM5560319.1 phage tail protein [Pleomorphomonas sp. JP5]